MYELTKEKENLIITKGEAQAIFSLKYYSFTTPTKGFGRLNTSQLTYSDPSLSSYIDIINILSPAGNVKNGLNKLSKNRWVELIVKSEIKIRINVNNRVFMRRIDTTATTVQGVLKIDLATYNYFTRVQDIEPWDLYEIQRVDSKNLHLLDKVGLEPSMNLFRNDFSYVDIMTNKLRGDEDRSVYKSLCNLVRLGYSTERIKSYSDNHLAMGLRNTESAICILNSYADWNEFVGRDYERYPKDLLFKSAMCSIESNTDHLEDRYSEVYTNKFDTENIFMPKTYEEYFTRAKEMKNCLFNLDQGYSWKIINKTSVILFSELEDHKACIELYIENDEYSIGDVLGIRNKRVPTKEKLEKELEKALTQL